MTVNRPAGPTPMDPGQREPGNARRNRGIRFSESEWEEVREAAKSHGATPAEFVREKVLALARNRGEGASSVPLPARLVPLIERTFRYSYVIATRMRADAVDDRERKRIEHLVSRRRRLQDSLKDDPPE